MVETRIGVPWLEIDKSSMNKSEKKIDYNQLKMDYNITNFRGDKSIFKPL